MPETKVHILTRDAMNWYRGEGVFGKEAGEARPCNFLPMTHLDLICNLLGRSIELEELLVMVQKETEETFDCSCGKCGKKVVPIKWLCLTDTMRRRISEGPSSLSDLEKHMVFNGVFKLKDGVLQGFAGTAYGFNKEEKNLYKSVYVTKTCLGKQYKSNKGTWPNPLKIVRDVQEGREVMKQKEEELLKSFEPTGLGSLDTAFAMAAAEVRR